MVWKAALCNLLQPQHRPDSFLRGSKGTKRQMGTRADGKKTHKTNKAQQEQKKKGGSTHGLKKKNALIEDLCSFGHMTSNLNIRLNGEQLQHLSQKVTIKLQPGLCSSPHVLYQKVSNLRPEG